MGKLFKFLNFLSRDYLRNYLAVGVNLSIHKCLEMIEDEEAAHPGEKIVYIPTYDLKRELRQAKKWLDRVFEM